MPESGIVPILAEGAGAIAIKLIRPKKSFHHGTFHVWRLAWCRLFFAYWNWKYVFHLLSLLMWSMTPFIIFSPCKWFWFAQPSKSWAFLCLPHIYWLSHIGVWRDWLVEINRASLQLSRLTLNPWSTESDSDADIADIRGQHFCLEVTLLGSV